VAFGRQAGFATKPHPNQTITTTQNITAPIFLNEQLTTTNSTNTYTVHIFSKIQQQLLTTAGYYGINDSSLHN
jgi:hypothetical protein